MSYQIKIGGVCFNFDKVMSVQSQHGRGSNILYFSFLAATFEKFRENL